jgi:putative DNA primase/helicase
MTSADSTAAEPPPLGDGDAPSDDTAEWNEPMTDAEVIELLGPGTRKVGDGYWVRPHIERDPFDPGPNISGVAEREPEPNGRARINPELVREVRRVLRERGDDADDDRPELTREVRRIMREHGDDDGERFFERGKLVPERLGAVIEGEAHLRLGIDGRLWRYHQTGVYRPDGDTYVKSRVRHLTGDRFRRHHIDEVLAWCRATFPSLDPTPNADVLNVANGLLNWRTGTLSPHSPDVPTTVQIPVAWRAEATCEHVDAFLAVVLPDDAVELVSEIIGNVLLAANPFRRAVLLLGPGKNGKTVLLLLIEALAGTANCSHTALQAFAENRFAGAGLLGKLANLCGDLDARAVRRSDTFKKVTGGDPIEAERKYGHAFSFRPFATMIFSANEPPISSDQSEAWFDRWLVIPMERRITDDEAVPLPKMVARLTTPDQLEGLLVAAVNGLRRLADRGRFAIPASVTTAGDHYRDRLDTVRAFITEECIVDPDTRAPRPQLYRHYRTWVQEGGRLPVSAATFNEHLTRSLGPKIDQTASHGTRYWIGIGLRTEEETTP